jgi:alkylated DNA repair dioxygenase AlkB
MLDPEFFDYHPNFIEPRKADAFLHRLWEELDWVQKEITLFGRKVMQPRLIAWHGDPGSVYRYSGLSLNPEPWRPVLMALRQRLEEFTGQPFNAVLANAYRDGRDSMGWHRDNENELGSDPFIASLSFGEDRRFLVRKKGEKSVGITLQHGSLLVMKRGCQQRFQHALPKTARDAGLRIKLTYRDIRDQALV